MISLATVNGTKDLTTKLYLMELIDMDWNTQVVRAFSRNNICGLLLYVRYGVFKIRGNMVAKRSRFGGSLVLNGTSPQLRTSNCLHFSEATAAIE